MILDENFAILDEDENIEDLENAEDETEVMDEGYIFDEDYDILNEALITSASAVDTSRSAKAIESVKKDFAKKISSGKYRNYKSSDKELLEKAINSKELKKRAAAEIAGAAIGSAFGATAGSFAEKFGKKGVSAIKNRKSNTDGEIVEESVNINEVLDEAIEFYMENVVDYLLDEEYEVLDEIKKPSAKSIKDYADKKNLARHQKLAKIIPDGGSLTSEYIKDSIITRSYQNKANKIQKKYDRYVSAKNGVKSGAKAVGSHVGNNKVGTGVGAGVGALSGAVLAKKLMSSMKFSVFTLNGLTILSLYATNKEGQAKNKSVCYAILTKSDDSKVLMQKINLKGK